MSEKQSPVAKKKAPAKAKAPPKGKGGKALAKLEPAQDADDALQKEEHQPVSANEEIFVREYLLDFNATRAYLVIHPTAKKTTAGSEGSRLLKKPRVQRRLAELAHARAEKLEIDGDALLRDAVAIAHADHRHLSQYCYFGCRHCNGIDNRYQRTVAEFEADREMHEKEQDEQEVKHYLADKPFQRKEFDEKGGDGFNELADPNPDCLNCHGNGIGRTVIADTRKLPADAVVLYAGMKETKDGIEILAHNKLKAHDMLWRNKGLYEKDNSQRAAAVSPETLTALAAAMDTVRARQLSVLADRKGAGFTGD